MLRAVVVAVFSAVFAGFFCSQDPGILDRARSLAKEGRTGAAIQAYEAWLTAAPTDKAVLREAATFAFRERRWFESAKWLERYVALDPSDPTGLYDLGALRHNQCRFDLAVPVFRQMEALEAGDPKLSARAEHRFLHGESARKLEHFAEAIPELEVAVARAPDRVEYRRSLAQALFDGGRFQAAVGEFAKVIQSEPTTDNYYGLGSALAEVGKVDEAFAALQQGRRLKARDGRTLLKLGLLALRIKDLRKAESYIIEARETAPKNIDVLYALAQIQRLSGQLEDARQTRAAAEESKKETDAALERGRVYSRAIVSNPSDVDAHVKYGLDLLSQARFEDAQVIFLRLLSFDPLNAIAILNLASLLARQGDTASAQKELKKLLEADESHEQGNLQMARIRLLLRDPTGALPYLRKAAARNPESRDAHELLASVWRALGDPDEAAKHDAILQRLRPIESRPDKD